MNDKVARLEEKIAFLEQALQELSEEHFAQKKELDRVSVQLESIKNKINNQMLEGNYASETYSIENEKPPHY